MKTVEELSDLAKTYEETILSNGLTKAEVVMLLALIDARVKSRLNSVAGVPAPVAKTTPTPPVVKSKGISYDPMYDPAPPFHIDTPPPRETSTGAILAKEGHACVCNICTKVVYVVNKDIPDNCKIPEFINSFTPTVESFPPLTRTAEIMNVDGQISTDCPLCKGNKSLYLTGKKGMDI